MSTKTDVWVQPLIRYVPHGTVFLANACIMILELVAGRIIARHVGMSLYTWTAIIGVIMAGISLGNHWGGKIADKRKPSAFLPFIFFAAGLSCILILPLNSLAGVGLQFIVFNWPLRIFLHVLVVFFVPSIFLGMITPVVAKMALDVAVRQGQTVGGLFASAVVGSLLGTFLAGYYLVMSLGATSIVISVAVCLGVIGILYFLSHRVTIKQPPLSIEKCKETHTPQTKTDLSRLTRYPAIFTVFLSNAIFMMFELAAMRVIAREFGSSLYTWTAIIGIVLAGVALGNYFGGRLADRTTSARCIAVVFGISGFLLLLSPLGNELAGYLRDHVYGIAALSWPMQITLQVFLLCFLPCVVVGMVSPLVVRSLLTKGYTSGTAVGIVYAWGSVGAILGTFVTGYLLIQLIGSLPVILLVSVIASLMALLYLPKGILSWILVVLCIFGFLASYLPYPFFHRVGTFCRLRYPSDPRTVYEDESQYSYIGILEDKAQPSVREMLLDQLVHTRVDLNEPTRLLYEYEWIYSAVMNKRHLSPTPVRVFVIGGGGYAYPHYLELTRPGSHIVVAEIDPAVTEAAHIALGLPRDTSIQIRNQDARNVVEDLLYDKRSSQGFEHFDYILGDSINDYTVPYHLTTLEVTEKIHALLKDDGVYMLNMIDMLDSGGFLAAVVNTCRKVFEQVVVFNTGRKSFIRDTFVVVCSKKPMFLTDIPLLLRSSYNYTGEEIPASVLDQLIERHKDIILTDDYAPVENLLAPVVRTRTGDLGELRLAFSRWFATRENYTKAIYYCRKALEVHPIWPDAHQFHAELLEKIGDIPGALLALEKAVEGNPDPAKALFMLGRAYMRASQPDKALAAWNRCITIKPDYVAALYNIGTIHAMNGNLGMAVSFWNKAINTDPDHEDSLYNLLIAYVQMGDFVSANRVATKLHTLNVVIPQEINDALEKSQTQE